jgi:hypothetical protein
MPRFTKSGQFIASRRVHIVPLENDAEIGLLDPTLADAKKLQTCREDIGGLATVLQPLIVNEDRAPVFESADELADVMPVSALVTICEFIGGLYDRKKAEKN